MSTNKSYEHEYERTSDTETTILEDTTFFNIRFSFNLNPRYDSVTKHRTTLFSYTNYVCYAKTK